MTPVTDPNLLSQLDSNSSTQALGSPVTDPDTISRLESNSSPNPVSGLAKNYEAYKTAANIAGSVAPWNQVKQGLTSLGGAISEGAGNLGARVSNGIPQYGIPPSPKIGAAIQGAGVVAGAVPAIGPDVLAAYSSLRGLYNPENPLAVGLTNSTKDISPQYAAQNEALGVSNDVPETANKIKYQDPYEYPSQLTKPKYVNGQPVPNPGGSTFSRPKVQLPADSGMGAAQPLPGNIPLQYPNDPASLINHINDTIDTHGANVPLQQLQDYKELLSTKMAGDAPEIPRGTPLFAKATQTSQKVNSTMNQVADPLLQKTKLPSGVLPTRTALNQAYSVASKRQQILEFIKKYGARTAEVAGTVGGLGAGAAEIYKYINGGSDH